MAICVGDGHVYTCLQYYVKIYLCLNGNCFRFLPCGKLLQTLPAFSRTVTENCLFSGLTLAG